MTEPTSFDAVYEAHFDFVWRVARRLGVPDSALDDAVQDAFMVVHARLHTFEGRAAMRTWLFGIVRRVARGHRPSRTEAGAVPEALEIGTPATAHEALERNESLTMLHRLLNGLDDDRREVFVLVELEQIPVTEVAEMLGLNVNTAHARLRAARQAMELGVARLRAAHTSRSPWAT